MNKVILSILPMLLLLVFLFGCSSSGDKETFTKEEMEQLVKERAEKESKGSEVEQKEVQQQVSSSFDAKKEAFEKYLIEVRPVMSDFYDVSLYYEELRSASADGQLSDYDFATALFDEVIPEGLIVTEDLEAIFPDKQFRAFHEKIIEMANVQHRAMTEIVSALETGDMSKITSANTLLSEARKIDREVAYELKELSDQYGVPLQ